MSFRRKYWLNLILFLIFWEGVTPAFCNSEPFIRKISYEEGLPTHIIYDLFINSKGYIYLGTNKGLIRFNGYEYKIIPIKGNLANSLTGIHEDSGGTIWCKNFSNQIFHLKNDTLQLVPIIQKQIQNDGNLREITVRKNELWIATQNRIFRYDITSKNLHTIHTISQTNSTKTVFYNQYYDIKYSPLNDVVYFSDLTGVYSSKNGKTTKINSLGEQKSISVNGNDVYIVPKGINNSIIDIKRNTTIDTKIIPKNTYYYYLSGTEKNLWLCTSSGIYEVNTKTNRVENPILTQQRISDIIKDHEGNTWISTLDHGLYFLPNTEIRCIKPQDISGNEKSNFTRLEKGPGNTIFAGSNQGIVYQIETNGVLKKHYESAIDNEIEFIYYDSIPEKLYYSHGLIDIKNRRIENQLSYGKSLFPDDKGNFLICTYSLAGLISKIPGSTPSFKSGEKVEIYGNIYSIYVINNVRSRIGYYSKTTKHYYIGSSDGLIVLDNNGNKNKIELTGNQKIIAYDIQEDTDGYIWISTIQNGLIKLKNNVVIEHITEKNGLSSNNCKRFSFYQDDIWIITDNGLNVVNRKTKKVQNISLSLALKGININDILSTGNQIWLACDEGILIIPGDIDSKDTKPLIYFNQLLVKGEKHNHRQALAFHQNDLEFDFEAIHYKSRGKYYYHYRLLGYDSSWINDEIQKNRVNYLSLPSGDYTFQVQAYSGDQYSEIIEIPFVISHPFWKSWWFILLSITSSIYVLILVYRLAEKRTRKQQLIKEKLALSQLTAIRAQMNPHFLFNVLNAIQGLIYAGKKYDATTYLGKFSDLMRKTLEMSDKQEILLSKEIESLKIYIELEAERFDHDFHYTIELSHDIDSEEIMIPSMIIQPYVENAIKHGLLHKKGEKQLNVTIMYGSENIIEVIIDDNGIGIKASEELNLQKNRHQSFATEAIKSRVQLLNEILENPISIDVIHKVDKDNISAGTTVKIIIPIKNE